ncbi:MAG: hypothetical protein E7Z88_07030 [Cyanobacteria bacterium SIG27]|nr:hypothetical protein [Cyanobacteria bacterium SIG27]
MSKKKVSILFVLVIVFASLLLFGCKHETIKFYRESAASTLINKFKVDEKNTTKRPAGMIILKDDNSSNKNGIQFGPGDINFDMPVRFK